MNVTFSFQTLQLPPPFAYAYTIELGFEQQELAVDFHLEYLNRDAITAEEILEEGFSTNDDFEWKGSLREVWSQHLKRELNGLKLAKPTDHDPVWIHIKSDKLEGNVAETDKWDFLLQELIQAIYEQAKRELPLKMKFINRIKGKSEFYELEGSFANRSCKVNSKPISWEEMQFLMSEVFALDFDGEYTDQPAKDGLWINPNGLSGYQAIEEISKKTNQLRKQVLKIIKS